jgi:EAL and modified HD-GYP domain-containing signal transduction protein
LNFSKNVTFDALNEISIARQPIVDADKAVVAHELFNRSQTSDRHSPSSDISLALHAIIHSGAPFSISSTDIFINTVHASLGGAQWEFLNPRTTVIEVPPVPNHDPRQIEQACVPLQDMRARGFRLSFPHLVVAPVYKAWQPLADFVKFDAASTPQHQYGAIVGAIKTRTPALAIAEKIEKAEQFEQLKSLGLQRFQGFWFSMPELTRPRVLSPGEISAMQLFRLVRDRAPIHEVELGLKKDAALGVSLLRVINSAGMGLSHKVSSLRQAIMLLGYQKLTRWSAMLLAIACADPDSMLGSSAVVRGRMMELLAESASDLYDPGSAFLIGLLSQLDLMMGTPMAQALEPLALDDEVNVALLQGEGRYGDLLKIAIASESEDDTAFASAFRRLGFNLRQINLAHLEALAWADQVEY